MAVPKVPGLAPSLPPIAIPSSRLGARVIFGDCLEHGHLSSVAWSQLGELNVTSPWVFSTNDDACALGCCHAVPCIITSSRSLLVIKNRPAPCGKPRSIAINFGSQMDLSVDRVAFSSHHG
ncbi:hypothetical protein V2G26_008437 [Clonostachys chloroleuca]